MNFNRIKIKSLLLTRQMKQYEFAGKLGVTETYLSKVLNGRETPSRDLKLKMLNILKKR